MKHPVRQWIHVIFISIACCIISSTGNISTVEAKTLNHTDGWFVSFSYPDPNKYGRIWIPPEAIKGTTLPLVILYHGAINGSVGSSDNPLDTTSGYVGPKARRRVDSIVHEQIKKIGRAHV